MEVKKMIYFDNAATTFPKPEVLYDALDKGQRELAFNAGRGDYKKAHEAHLIIEETRDFLCAKANAKTMIFASSATQALNQIIAGISFTEGDVVYCSPYDHNAVARTLYAYSKKDKFILKQIPLKNDLSVDLDKFEFDVIRDKPCAIFCTHVSNVTGYILPIEQIGEIAKRNNSIFVVDGAQAFGLIEVNMEQESIDYYVFAGHKTLYGPFGVAGYFTNKLNDLNVTVFGGTGSDSLNLKMPKEGTLRYEPSSHNVVAINGLLASAKWVFSTPILNHEKKLYEYSLEKLQEIDEVTLYLMPKYSTTGIISFNVDRFSSLDISKILSEEYDIALRAGYHCAPFVHEYLNDKQFLGTVRLSVGYFNTKEEIDKFIDVITEIIEGI